MRDDRAGVCGVRDHHEHDRLVCCTESGRLHDDPYDGRPHGELLHMPLVHALQERQRGIVCTVHPKPLRRAVHFNAQEDLPNDSSYCSSARTVTPLPETKTSRVASPANIRRAASVSSRTPSSDDFDGMRKQSTVELSKETIKLYTSCEKSPRDEFFKVYSPNDREDEKSTLFGSTHYT